MKNRVVSFAGPSFERWLKRRQEWGGDRRDEVWDGVYIVMPSGDNNHQELTGDLTSAIDRALESIPGVAVYPGVNVSDDRSEWMSNYRCPDVAVFLPGNPAENRDTHFFGGPDFAVEIVSRHDRCREKFGFYAKTGVRELLFVDRAPEWSLELHRRHDDRWTLVDKIVPDAPESLVSEILSISFRLIEATSRPHIAVTRLRSDINMTS